MVWALGGYVRELVWPLPLNAYVDEVPQGLGALAGLALLAGALGWGVVRWRAGDWPWLFAALWIPLTIAPSLAILWKIPEVPMAERYAYLPSVGVALLVGIALERAGWAAQPRRLLLVAPVVALAALAVWQRNPVWHDDVALWSDTAGKTAVSGMAWRSLGAAYLNAGRDVDAESPLRRALEFRNPPLGVRGIYSNLGTIEMRKQRFREAEALYRKAVESGASDPDVIFNLGLSILYGGDQNEAAARASLPYFERAAEMSPYDPDIDAVLGQVYATLGERNRAEKHLRDALAKGVRPETRAGVERLLRDLEASGAGSREP
jgi:Tfp pilus assembly protein PilF